MKIGIIGSGHIGGTLAHRLSALGHDVTVANSRGPQSLAALAAESGATAGTVEQAADAELVVLAVPLAALDVLEGKLDGKLVVDADNYYPQRDGTLDVLENGTPSSVWTAERLGATVVKAFNTILWSNLRDRGVPAGDPRRLGLPVAGDDGPGKQTVLELVEALGFDAVDGGALAESWRQQPGTPVYGAELDAAQTRAALAAA